MANALTNKCINNNTLNQDAHIHKYSPETLHKGKILQSHTHTHTCTHTHMYTCTHTFTHVHMHIHTHNSGGGGGGGDRFTYRHHTPGQKIGQ